MTAKPPQAVLWGRLAWHPAVQAWTAFTGESAVPEQIEVLRRGKKSATFRLVGAGPNGESIIAQRSRPAKASVERTIYEDILPGLHLPAPRVYGSRADDDDDYVWLFLQDLGNERYSPTDPAHRALAGRWIGMLHARARDLPLARVLPDGGPARYRRHLRAGRHAIRVNVANPLLAAADVVLLDRLAKTLDRVEGDWDRLDETCTRTPATLVHGDIQRKNMYVRAGDDGIDHLARVEITRSFR